MIKAEVKLYRRGAGDSFTVKLHRKKREMRYWRAIRERHRKLPDRDKLVELNNSHTDANIGLTRRQINEIMSTIGKEIIELRDKGTEIREKELQEKLEQRLQGDEDLKKGRSASST